MSLLTTQTALTEWQNIIRSFRHLPKILGKKSKATNKVTLLESPIKRLAGIKSPIDGTEDI